MASKPISRENPGQRHGAAPDLLAKAAQCRRLAAGVCDREAAEVLRAMAENYEAGARLN